MPDTPQRLNYMELAPEAMSKLQALEHALNTRSEVEPILLELVRLRCSLMNGCNFCIAHHSSELRKHNETAERVAAVADWRNTDLYTQRERAGLAWAETVTEIQQPTRAPDVLYEQARAHFSDVELANLTIAIASINAWNRIGIAFRMEPHEHGSKTASSAQDPSAQGSSAQRSSAQDPSAQGSAR